MNLDQQNLIMLFIKNLEINIQNLKISLNEPYPNHIFLKS